MEKVIDGIDYGPLAMLLGKWVGQRGLDVAPDINADPDKTAYIDELTFTVAGGAENAEEQNLVAVKYHHVVRKKENGCIFHDQIGHWIYDSVSGVVMHSLTIPRGVCILAGGTVTENSGEFEFDVSSKAGSDTFGIVQSPFMLEKAKTKAFHMNMKVNKHEISYKEIMSLFIYGKEFEHVDSSVLKRVVYDGVEL